MRLSVVATSLVCLLALGIGACVNSANRTERHGNFDIEYRRVDAFGHIGTRKTLYHVNGQRRTLVTESGAFFVLAPYDADRVIYYTCDSGASAPAGGTRCAHMYFDGHTERSHVIGRDLKVSMSQLEDGKTQSSHIQTRWTKNYVVLGDQFEFVLLDLTTGTSTRLAEMLGLQEPHYPEKWQHRIARWGGWSPEGTHAAIIVASPQEPGPPVLEWEEELYSLDASTRSLAHVATHVGTLGGAAGNSLWDPRRFQWDGTELQPPR